MGKSNSKVSMYLNFALLISLLLIINIAESRLSQFGHGKAKASTVLCLTIYAQKEGDTCSTISDAFNLNIHSFMALNPNLNCDKIFVGEWLCVDGLVS
ncbi:hypothetical protein V6N13_100414 [Hibiscus sabdariffa]|uniref:LysM domain-containing protein n=2 Tax=Hibiscus sabdariffa TaxID=183260 RepID=A0ABR2BTR5_9ROSI